MLGEQPRDEHQGVDREHHELQRRDEQRRPRDEQRAVDLRQQVRDGGLDGVARAAGRTGPESGRQRACTCRDRPHLARSELAQGREDQPACRDVGGEPAAERRGRYDQRPEGGVAEPLHARGDQLVAAPEVVIGTARREQAGDGDLDRRAAHAAAQRDRAPGGEPHRTCRGHGQRRLDGAARGDRGPASRGQSRMSLDAGVGGERRELRVRAPLLARHGVGVAARAQRDRHRDVAVHLGDGRRDLVLLGREPPGGDGRADARARAAEGRARERVAQPLARHGRGVPAECRQHRHREQGGRGGGEDQQAMTQRAADHQTRPFHPEPSSRREAFMIASGA